MLRNIHTYTNIQRESSVQWDTHGPSTVSSYVHIKIQRTVPFSSKHLEYKNTSTLWPPVLCQDKICSLPTASCVGLSLPELYLPPIIVNCLLCEIYSVRLRVSSKHKRTWGILWGYWECCSCHPNNDKWQRDRLRCFCLCLRRHQLSP